MDSLTLTDLDQIRAFARAVHEDPSRPRQNLHRRSLLPKLCDELEALRKRPWTATLDTLVDTLAELKRAHGKEVLVILVGAEVPTNARAEALEQVDLDKAISDLNRQLRGRRP